MKQKVLIFGPISDFGGREIEAGFIAEALATDYEVEVCSTETITSQSQVFTFNKKLKAFSLNKLVQQQHFLIRVFAFIAYLMDSRKNNLIQYTSNSVSKKHLDYRNKKRKVLQELLLKQDLIFFCGQFSSNYSSMVVDFAKKNNKKVIFRTTGTIHSATHYPYLEKIDCFVHHSQSNARHINHLANYNYEIADQCAFNELALSQVPPSENEIRKFLVLTRLSPEKGIAQVIEYFLREATRNDVLYIAGTGPMEKRLHEKYNKEKSIRFLGFVPADELADLFKKIHCVIIPSPEESGPLVGIEAMCAGKIILSTQVGAMPERLKGTLNDFWYEYDNFESFQSAFAKVKSLTVPERRLVYKSLKDRYESDYTTKKIAQKYLNIVKKTLK